MIPRVVVGSTALTVWVRPHFPEFGEALFIREHTGGPPVPTLILEQRLANDPDRDWYVSHEVSHLALSHGRLPGRMTSYWELLPIAWVVASVVGFLVAAVMWPSPAWFFAAVPTVSGMLLPALMLTGYWSRQRESAADAFAATQLHARMTPTVVVEMCRRESSTTRRWPARLFRGHPLPERRLAALESLQTQQSRKPSTAPDKHHPVVGA